MSVSGGLVVAGLMKYSLVSVMVMLMVCLNNLFTGEEHSGLFIMSELNWLLSSLVVVLLLMVLYECGKTLISVVPPMVVSSLIISVNSMAAPPPFHEMLFVLTTFPISVLGYSFERLTAGLTMMFYSFPFSSPTMILLIMMDSQCLLLESLEFSSILTHYTACSFIVKFPISSFHYWSPVAHVEASTSGSITLAGTLSKMGGLGVWYVIKFLKFMVKLHWLSIGYLLMMAVISFMSDSKITAAHSPVAHTSFMFHTMMRGFTVGTNGSTPMMFYHGITPSLTLWVIGLLSWTKTRSSTVTKLVSFSNFSMVTVPLVLILNTGFPPFTGFMSEISMLKSVMVYGKSVLVLSSVGVLFSCHYNIFMFWGSNGISDSFSSVEMKLLSVLVVLLLVTLFINHY